MQNTQRIEKRLNLEDGKVEVHSIFPTIQGEGPFCGRPCVFVRLTGCNLQCPFCDTEYTSNREVMTPQDVIVAVRSYRKNGLVVITGGEPFRQNLTALFAALTDAGYYIQVETNGTLPPSQSDRYSWDFSFFDKYCEGKVFVVCSPKTGKVNSEIFDVACALKYVVAHDDVRKEDGLPLHALGHSAKPYVARPPSDWMLPIYIQPMDAQDEHENRLNNDTAVNSAMRFGYTLQIQIHKIVGVE